MIFVYENLRDGIDQSKEHLIDNVLMKIDGAIFGVVPSLWLEKWYHPIAVDVMSVMYALYFLIPCTVMFCLYMRGHMREFRICATSMVITLALGYSGYLLFPAAPPRFSPVISFTNPVSLQGVFFFNASQNIWDNGAVASRFCAFPSLHVGLSGLGAFWGLIYNRLLPKRIWILSFLIFMTLMLSFAVSFSSIILVTLRCDCEVLKPNRNQDDYYD
jgi:hypothetical protein